MPVALSFMMLELARTRVFSLLVLYEPASALSSDSDSVPLSSSGSGVFFLHLEVLFPDVGRKFFELEVDFTDVFVVEDWPLLGGWVL